MIELDGFTMPKLKSFLEKDTERITGKIAASLALKSPWMDILSVEKDNRPMKNKHTIILKNFTQDYDNRTILFHRELKLGKQCISLRDLLPNTGPRDDNGSWKFIVQYIPAKKRSRRSVKTSRKNK